MSHQFPVEMKSKQGEQYHDGHQQYSGADSSLAGVAQELHPAKQANLHQKEEDTQHSREGPGSLNVPVDEWDNLDVNKWY